MIDVFVKKGSMIFVRMSEDVEIDAVIKPAIKGYVKDQFDRTIFTNFRLNMTDIDLLINK